MKGLWIKDWLLLMQQKTFFLVVVGISVFCVLSGQDLLFMVSYSSFLVVSVAVSTISYDDTANGLAYIFTWPASRKQYVLEKYLFAGCTAGAAWALAVAAGAIFGKSVHSETGILDWLLQSLMILALLIITLSVMIPIKLKFGAEKGRIVTFVVIFAMFGALGLVQTFYSGALPQVETAVHALAAFPSWTWTAFTAVFAAAVLTGSVCISIRIAEKKEL